MEFWMTIKMSLNALLRNKGRTFLTALGIIIGVASVIAMLAITTGASKRMMGFLEGLGNNVLFIFASSRTKGGVSGGWFSINTLKPSDAVEIQKNCPHIKYTSPHVWADVTLIYENRNWQSSVMGVNEKSQYIRNENMVKGSYITGSDVQSATKVCMIGSGTVEKLFLPNEEPLGEVIRINKVPFKVIGVIVSKGSDEDNVVKIPYTTMMQRIYKKDNIQMIVASATSREDTEKAYDEVSRILRERHKLTNGKDDDFSIQTQQEIIQMVEKFSKTISLLFGAVAGVSLIVGGIGIMNIMLVSVTERIREIGIRMAVGARRIDILRQFLIESITLSLSGGTIGIIFGYILTGIVKKATQWDVFISPFSIILSLGFAIVVGVFFGLYPAIRASNLDPIEALRHE